MIIDMHTHILIKEAFKKMRKRHDLQIPRIFRDAGGKEFLLVNGGISGPLTEQLYNPEKRIEDMNRENIDLQVLSVVPFTFSYFADSSFASALASAQNDAISELVEEYQGRFIGLATVSLQNVDRSVEELDRAMMDLGLKGVEIGSNIGGKNLDSFELWPFYEKVQELDVPILVHPINPTGAERMHKYYLTNLIGFPMETSLAIASIIFGGVLQRFPKLKFLFVHAGGFIPYQRGRLEHGYKVRSEPKVNVSEPPSEYLRLIYFDTTTHFKPALTYLIATVGSDNVLMGSDFPYDMADPHPVLTVEKMGLSPEDKEKILGENSVKIFNIHTQR